MTVAQGNHKALPEGNFSEFRQAEIGLIDIIDSIEPEQLIGDSNAIEKSKIEGKITQDNSNNHDEHDDHAHSIASPLLKGAM